MNKDSCESITNTLWEDRYRIEEAILINYKGEKYPKIAYQSALHEDLAFVLKDPEQALILHEAYVRNVFPFLPEKLQSHFARALLKVCFLFGAQHFSCEKTLALSLEEENPSFTDWIQKNRTSFQLFCQEANRPARPNLRRKKGNPIPTIVILTTSASGGNYSVAEALESFLFKKKMHPILLDIEKIAEETDLIMLATGASTYDGIYATCFQQKNLGSSPLNRRESVSKQLGKYIPSCLCQKLKEFMRQLQPDMILSTRSYTTDDICLCTLGVPFRMIHIDFELSSYFMNLYGKIDPQMFKFWLPILEPCLFRPFFERYKRLDLYNEKDNAATTMKKIAEITQQPFDVIQGQFERLDYPVRSAFSSISSPALLGVLRKKWHLQENEIPILVTMGKNGSGILEEIFEKLLISQQHMPIKYIFVCGHNVALKERLSLRAKSNRRFLILGLLSAQEMNEWMNLSPLIISKPGGAMTAEVLLLGSYLLISHTYRWEKTNGCVIEKMGLGEKENPSLPLAVQVEECLKKPKQSKKQSNEWKSQLMHYLKSLLATD